VCEKNHYNFPYYLFVRLIGLKFYLFVRLIGLKLFAIIAVSAKWSSFSHHNLARLQSRAIFILRIEISVRVESQCPLWGQKRTCAAHKPMSALPPIATLIARSCSRLSGHFYRKRTARKAKPTGTSF
jgi:hypothetical protein